MGNILFQNNQAQNKFQNNPVLDMANNLRQFGPSEILYQKMYSSNPDFKTFADSVRNLGPDQAFKQNGLNFDQFRQFKW